MTRRPPWLAPALGIVIAGAIGMLLSTAFAPVVDPRPLKMSCFWASRAVVPLHALIALGGLIAAAQSERASVRPVAVMVVLVAAAVPIMVHLAVPTMPHNLPRAFGHDLLAAVAGLLALGARWAARPETDLHAALDALAAGAEQPGA